MYDNEQHKVDTTWDFTWNRTCRRKAINMIARKENYDTQNK